MVSDGEETPEIMWSIVLILVLMEDGLWHSYKGWKLPEGI